MAEEYVTKEVFDARMDRMEALLEKTLIEMKADNEKFRRELRENVVRLESKINAVNDNLELKINAVNSELGTKIEAQNIRIDKTNARIDRLHPSIFLFFFITIMFIAILARIISLAGFFEKSSKPQITTMEDVENAIDIAIKKAGLQKSQ